ncbi:hypothetical protein LQ948_14985 [Jiella sp. MQZ9-1]|uniref:Uncharacterized protein n=1 Tax=Jiella flava TaxID=2816857 RepID=A0A939FXS2_9HYPH|nr:hypothetical protein [Jiella flava]MBO0663938.1 hypothetical protein [Jiella flava]MCD2472510.1 hypothetical protein [Jiella flava]
MRLYDPFFAMPWLEAPKALAEMTTIATFAPLVVATRLSQLGFAIATAPTARDGREATRMVSEKLDAAREATAAMQTAFAKAGSDAVVAAMTGRRAKGNPADAIVSAGLAPYAKRVRANHRRLSRP